MTAGIENTLPHVPHIKIFAVTYGKVQLNGHNGEKFRAILVEWPFHEAMC